MNTLYSSRTCAYCPTVKKFMQMRGIEYTEVDVTDDINLLRPASDISGVFTVPQLKADDGRVIVGNKLGEYAELAG